MLCGAILCAPPPSVSTRLRLAGPQQCSAMAAIAAAAAAATAAAAAAQHAQQQQRDRDDLSFIENGLLSYENPNYHLDPARLDAAIYGELYDAVSRPRRIIQADNQLDLETEDGDSKDVDGYDDDLEDDYSDNRRRECMEDDEPMLMKTNPINLSDKEALLTPPGLQGPGDESPPPEKERADQRATEKRGPACVPHVARGPNNDLYAVPVKLRPRKDADTEKVDADARDLPPGWEKHEDNDGPYYWHIKSGTIQREMPEMPPQEVAAKDNSKKQMVKEPSNLSEIGKFESGNNAMTSSVTRSTTSCCLDADADVDRKRKEELALKRRSYPAKPEPDCGRAVRFFVRSLGWVEIAESDLTPERSSRAVNKCIVDLSLGRNDLLDVVGRWGDGKDLFMDLDEGALKLMDPENLTTLHTQPIHTIRVWGVGRDNGRDFAYVARDRATRRHMCHVFRCDMPARTIANTLRDICKRIMIERSLAQAAPASRPARPTDLPTRQRHTHVQSFPTPMEEPRKVVRAQYLGSASVCRATGMDVLNAAIARLASPSPGETPQRRHVSVAVAPSMISITPEGDMNPSVECRVRYLSFLGIGRDVRHCAFIMHTAQDQFVAHVFQCEPSSGALCKTIEAACKLRYQKCLDAHPGSTLNGGLTAGSTTTVSQGSSAGLGSGGSGELRSPGGSTRVGIGATLKSFVGSLAAAASRRPS